MDEKVVVKMKNKFGAAKKEKKDKKAEWFGLLLHVLKQLFRCVL